MLCLLLCMKKDCHEFIGFFVCWKFFKKMIFYPPPPPPPLQNQSWYAIPQLMSLNSKSFKLGTSYSYSLVFWPLQFCIIWIIFETRIITNISRFPKVNSIWLINFFSKHFNIFGAMTLSFYFILTQVSLATSTF